MSSLDFDKNVTDLQPQNHTSAGGKSSNEEDSKMNNDFDDDA